MKVTAVTPFIVHPGYGKNWLFVKVETSDGLHGWGECYTQADRDQSIAAHVRQLARYLAGRDASHIRHFTHWAYHDFASKRGAMDFWSAVSGIEQALWDLAGKRLGVPVVTLLGGPCRERIRVYANGWYSGATTPEAFAAKAKDTVARGFSALKFDPFPGPWRTHISRDAERQAVDTVGLAATLQVSAAIPNFLITEYFVNFEPRGREIAVNPFRVEGGYLAVPTAPGLGIDLREDVLARYADREFPARTVPTPGDEGP